MKQRIMIHKMTLMAILSAIIILMSFTPLGYLKIGTVEITFIVVPVAIGAILVDPFGGLFLGGIFGITSFIQGLTGMSPFGATLLSINPFFFFLLCIPTRMLMGYCAGLVFKVLKKHCKHDIIAHITASISASLFNTIFFMTTLCLCYYNTDFIQGLADSLGASNVFMFIILLVSLNGLIEIGVNFIIGATVSKTIYLIYSKKHPHFEEELEKEEPKKFINKRRTLGRIHKNHSNF